MSLASKVMEAFKRDLAEVVLVPSDGGRFEVSLDGEPIYSKLETGSFPDADAIVSEVRKRLSKAKAKSKK